MGCGTTSSARKVPQPEASESMGKSKTVQIKKEGFFDAYILEKKLGSGNWNLKIN
jgi:hypothetical protein